MNNLKIKFRKTSIYSSIKMNKIHRNIFNNRKLHRKLKIFLKKIKPKTKGNTPILIMFID